MAGKFNAFVHATTAPKVLRRIPLVARASYPTFRQPPSKFSIAIAVSKVQTTAVNHVVDI